MRPLGALSECFCCLVTGKTQTLMGAKVTLKATDRLPSEVKTFSSDIPGRAHCWLGPTLLPSLPQSPFCSSAVVASDLPPWASCWAPGCPHRVTSGPGMSFSLEKRDFIVAVSTYKQTHPPSGGDKEKGENAKSLGGDQREGKMSGKDEAFFCTFPPPPTSRKGETQGSPPFAAAVPAVGAGLAPLWGGHILLPVLGGRRRASPFADLGGEEDTQTCSRTAPESVLS